MIITESITRSEPNTEFIVEINGNDYKLELFEDGYLGYETQQSFEIKSVKKIGAKAEHKKPFKFIKANMDEIIEQVEYQLKEHPFSLL